MAEQKPRVEPWLEEGDYNKAVFQLRAQVDTVFDIFRVYGMQIYVPQAVEEIVKLAEDFGLRIRGQDKPINIERIRRRR